MFYPQLGTVLANFANQSHTVVVKTLNIQPADLAPGGMGEMSQYAGGAYVPGYNREGGAYGGMTPPVATRPGALPTIIDEKKLKVTMLLDFVKILPAQGR